MVKSYFYFNGKSSLDLGLTIEYCPNFSTGQRSVNKQTVPGRNGDLVMDDGTYSNYTSGYDIWFKDPINGTTQAARNIAHWLLNGQGYQRLEDSYDPEIYRMALFTGPFDVDNWMLTHGRATLEFDFMPQRFLKSGETPINVQSGQGLYNNWMPTKPLLLVTGNGTLSVGGTSITVSGTSGEFYIDCEAQDAWQGLSNLNGNIEVENHEYPVIPAGKSQVTYSGIAQLKIIPRWWTL